MAKIYCLADSGAYQIDQTYKNLSLSAKGSRVIPASGSVAPGAGNNPLSIPTTATCFIAYAATGTLQVNGPQAFTNVSGADLTLTWYVFDVGVGTGASFGCQVFNAAGQLIFDAAGKQARVRDYSTSLAGNGDPADWVGTRTYDAGRSYAVVFGRIGDFQKVTYVPGTTPTDPNPHYPLPGEAHYIIEKFRTAFRAVSGGVEFTANRYQFLLSTGTGSPVFSDSRMQMMALDVTGY